MNVVSSIFSENSSPRQASNHFNGAIVSSAPIIVKRGRSLRPFNVLALFFNGLSLGCMWGVIFSFLEGRRVTDLLASLFGLSIAVSSGTAKSIGLFVVDTLHVSEFWMPELIGAVALPLLAGLGYILDHLPKPTAEDKALRVERVTLNKQQRWNLFRSFAPILTLLFFANLFLTVLQDVKEDFLVKIIDVNAAGLSPWVFAKVDGVVTLIILAIFATLAVMKSHIARLVIYPEPLPLFFLLELSNHFLRPLHRLFPHQGKCRFLHSDGRFHRLHRHSGGIGSERMFQPGFKLAGILQYDGRDSRNRLHLCVHLSNDLSDTKIQKRETG